MGGFNWRVEERGGMMSGTHRASGDHRLIHDCSVRYAAERSPPSGEAAMCAVSACENTGWGMLKLSVLIYRRTKSQTLGTG